MDGDVESCHATKIITDKSTIARKERPLKLLREGRKTILTLDRELFRYNNGICYMNLIDFLFGE